VSKPAASAGAAALAPFALFSASYFAHIGFFNPYLPLWLKDQGLGLFVIGVLTSVQAATRLFAPYAWGALSDRTGERVKLLRFGSAVAALASIGLWFDGGVWWLALVLLVTFTHTSAMMSMAEAAMAHLVSRDGVFDARRYGRIRMWGSAGFLLMVFVAGLFFERFGMSFFPAITTLSLLVVVASSWRLPDHPEPRHAEGARIAVGPVLRQPVLQWFFAAMFFHILSHMGIYIFFSLYLDSLGYSKTVIGLLWALAVLAEIGWFYSQGRWMAAFSLGAWLVLTSAVTSLRMGALAAGANLLPLLLLSQLAHALSFAAHHATCIALVSEYFPDRLRARGQALFTVVGYGLPGVLAGLAGGALSSRFGLQSVFWACAATGVLAMACSFRVWRLRSQPHGAAG